MGKRNSKAKATTAPASWTRGEMLTSGLVGFVLLFMDFSVRVRSAANKSIDFQVLIKMLVWALAALWVAGNYKQVLALVNRVSIPWLLLFGWMGVTALYSVSPLLTLASAGSLILMVLFWLGSANVLGERRLVQAMFWGMVAFCAASLILLAVNPYLAQSAVRINGERIMTHRLQGFTGQANALGRTAAFASLLGLLYFDTLKRKLGWFALAPVGVAVATLALTQSRTSGLALALAGVFYLCLRSRRRWLVPVLAIVLAAAAVFIVPNFERLAISIARSGDPTEIYTATNRIYIWHLVAWLIQQKPILGWGYNTASTHLAAYSKQVSPELGSYVPPNSHDAFLEVTFAGGFIALALFLAAAAINVAAVVKHRHQRGQTLMLFWFVTSFTEVAGFTGVVSASTVTMLLPMALGALAESRSVAQPSRRSSVARRDRAPAVEPMPPPPAPKPRLPDPPAPKGVIEVRDIG
jgi:O-antigen ligase